MFFEYWYKIFILDSKFFSFSSDYDVGDDIKNPLAAAGAVKDALSTGGVDKVREKIKIETSLGTQLCLETKLSLQWNP